MLDLLKNRIKAIQKTDWPLWVGLSYVLVLNIPHTVAAQYILTGAMFFAVAAQFFSGGGAKKLSAIDLWFFALIVACLVSTFLSPYFWQSFSQIRKDVIPYLLAFIIFASQSDGTENRERIVSKMLYIIVFAFAIRTMLATWDFIANGFDANIYGKGTLPKYLNYYAIDAVLYVPIVTGVLFFVRLGRLLKVGLAFLLVVALGIVFVSEIRTAFLLCFITTGGLLAWRFWNFFCRNRLVITTLLAATLVSLFVYRDNQGAARYKTIFEPQSYMDKSTAMSGRYPIWMATMEIVATRPLIGYGEGWKKLPLVAEETGLLQKWSDGQNALLKQAAEYMKLGAGVVNPHNLYLLILFEAGILGLIAFLGLLGAMLVTATSIIKSSKGSPRKFRFSVAVISIIYTANYLLLGVTNATWFTGSFLVIMIALSLLSPNKEVLGSR